MSRFQTGHVYEAFSAFHVQYYQTELKGGKERRVRRSHRLCAKDRIHYSTTCKAVKTLCGDFMRGVNETSEVSSEGMTVTEFWEKIYLPYCEKVVELTGKPRKKPSTVRGYKQIWNQHLEGHFGKLTLQEYTAHRGTRFLQTLTDTQVKSTLRHIKALGSSIFKRAVVEQKIKANPWRDVVMPDDAIESDETQHYTMAEAEDLVSALVDHPDAQLVIAVSCFLGLRPGETAALKWEDFDTDSVYIRRSVVRGRVDTPKTKESIATLPLIDQVRVPLELWRKKSDGAKQGWVFPSRNNTPVDLHNLSARVIRPHVEGVERCVECDLIPKKSGVAWKTLYAGRRGAITAVIEANNGNIAVGQALARHKDAATTSAFYKKQITPKAFKASMKLLEQSIESKEEAQ